MTELDVPRVPLQVTQGCILATLQGDLQPGFLDQFKQDLLARIRQAEARGIVIDLSALDLMDLTEFEALKRLAAMADVLGARTVVVGLRPGVVAGLVALGADASGLKLALNVELGLGALKEMGHALASHEREALPEALARALEEAG